MLTDARPGSTAEREPRVAVPGLLLLRSEPLRVKALRLSTVIRRIGLRSRVRGFAAR